MHNLEDIINDVKEMALGHEGITIIQNGSNAAMFDIVRHNAFLRVDIQNTGRINHTIEINGNVIIDNGVFKPGKDFENIKYFRMEIDLFVGLSNAA